MYRATREFFIPLCFGGFDNSQLAVWMVVNFKNRCGISYVRLRRYGIFWAVFIDVRDVPVRRNFKVYEQENVNYTLTILPLNKTRDFVGERNADLTDIYLLCSVSA